MVVFLASYYVLSIGLVEKFLGMMWQCLVWKDKRLAFNWPLLHRGLIFMFVLFFVCIYLYFLYIFYSVSSPHL